MTNQEAIGKLESYCEWCLAQGGYCQAKLDGCEIADALVLLRAEQPPASEFTKECRQKLSDSCCAIIEDFPGWRTTTAEARVMSFEACDRLDASEASRKELLGLCKEALPFVIAHDVTCKVVSGLGLKLQAAIAKAQT